MSETVQQQVRAIRKGTLFRLKDSGTAPVWSVESMSGRSDGTVPTNSMT